VNINNFYREMIDLQLLLSLCYRLKYMKECFSVSFASKNGWVLMFADRHCGLLPIGSLITHTHTHTHKYIYMYIHLYSVYWRTQIYAHMGVT